MKKIIGLFLVISLLLANNVKADEGMWLPVLLKKLNIKDMQEKGFKLSAKDIYDVNEASMKDAIVKFGRGCTGELISDQGLLITNHHCGFGQIQQHSSVEHDYLTDGFWSMSLEEELPNPKLTVTFLVRMEDVSKKVLKGTSKAKNETERDSIIKANSKILIAKAEEGNHYKASVESFYYGNEYYLFVNEIYKDIRLVGAPPSAIGKFGGDTDNWMWPRHTGDFSLFRIYADKDNKPAEYAEDNVPYKPKKHFTISTKGIEEGDFTMVFGYPARTNEYLTSNALLLDTKVRLPHKIALRTTRLEIMNSYMEKDRAVRIQYASKNAGVSNAWKKWQGIIKGLKRLDAVNKKLEFEEAFNLWANSSKKYASYTNVISEINKAYDAQEKYALAEDYKREAASGIEILRFADRYNRFVKEMKSESPEAIKEKAKADMLEYNKSFFKDYYMPIDKEIFVKLMQSYAENVHADFHPEIFKEIETRFDGCFKTLADELYANSIFVSHEKMEMIVNELGEENIALIENDMAFKLINSFNDVYNTKVADKMKAINSDLQLNYRKYMAGILLMKKDELLYPDANFTLRVAYGEVKGYEAADAVIYDFYTTLDGIIEKDNPEIYDYDVPAKLKELVEEKDFGAYESNNTVPVCFTATNHSSGGNSGSPVVNANGELIGVNFDRCWEGTMSDYMFDPDYCRNISLDIRYALFLIDKFAGATRLIDEMTIVN